MKVAFTPVLVMGLCITASCLVTENVFISSHLHWQEALSYCQNHYSDLSYVRSDAEVTELLNAMDTNQMSWIGLSRHDSSWKWTNGDPLTYHNWAPGQPHNDHDINCASTASGLWYANDCNAKHAFYCARNVQEMVVVENPMVWEEALVYCRNHYQDLVSLALKTELILALQKAKNFQGTHFWTGLRFLDDSWLWVDGEKLRNGSWSADPLPKCPAEPFRCGALSTFTNSQEVRSCEEQLSYICYAE
ncbi:lymphocyte antigen 75-like [Brienomyrus brachyistius]|uniref:lymphocyte antigen 75-like n=1 Tax=Brienomyrus brachyistius TaxID=42636 RepID=UPI0020B373A9|nr:lymphocyte antigen 75-like [Brienomyrus brachyistius]